MRTVGKARFVLCLGLVAAGLTWADSGANHRTSSDYFGVSGGNVNDASRAFCCSGTIGSLLIDSSGGLHALSNNHVFARSNQASPGEDISQPGLVDNACRVAERVADLDPYPALGSNVDAATGTLRGEAMRADGAIMDIGQVSGAVAPIVGASVAKSGRTSGLTAGSIQSVNTSVNVQYQRGCGGGKKFVISYTNQVVTSGGMIAAGDSGSLLVDTTCRATALLFAGDSSGRAIGNPIGEVLTKVGTALGKSVDFVTGSSCSLPGGSTTGGALQGPSQSAVDHATSVLQEHLPELMRGAVVGAGVGAADNNPAEAVLVLYIERGGAAPDLPDQLRGVRVKRVFTSGFEAFPACGSCAACK